MGAHMAGHARQTELDDISLAAVFEAAWPLSDVKPMPSIRKKEIGSDAISPFRLPAWSRAALTITASLSEGLCSASSIRANGGQPERRARFSLMSSNFCYNQGNCRVATDFGSSDCLGESVG